MLQFDKWTKRSDAAACNSLLQHEVDERPRIKKCSNCNLRSFSIFYYEMRTKSRNKNGNCLWLHPKGASSAFEIRLISRYNKMESFKQFSNKLLNCCGSNPRLTYKCCKVERLNNTFDAGQISWMPYQIEKTKWYRGAILSIL